jgi:hypothetical protein
LGALILKKRYGTNTLSSYWDTKSKIILSNNKKYEKVNVYHRLSGIVFDGHRSGRTCLSETAQRDFGIGGF